MSGQILVVDDDAVSRTVVARLLVHEGYSVLLASNGEAALEMATGLGSLDVLVTDIEMPGIDGLEVADRLLRWRDIAVVVMSGGGSGREATLRRSPHCVFLQKPFSRAELLEALVAARRRTARVVAERQGPRH